MNLLEQFLHNPVMIAPVCGWLVAQILKTGIHTFFNKEFVPERLVGGGGMPSSHSATVCALATATAFRYGFGGFEFPMAAIFAFVTMYDAMGVRRETGRQGEVLNDLIEAFARMGKDVGPEKALKELIGHSPLQVSIGALLGIVIALVICNLSFFAG